MNNLTNFEQFLVDKLSSKNNQIESGQNQSRSYQLHDLQQILKNDQSLQFEYQKPQKKRINHDSFDIDDSQINYQQVWIKQRDRLEILAQNNKNFYKNKITKLEDETESQIDQRQQKLYYEDQLNFTIETIRPSIKSFISENNIQDINKSISLAMQQSDINIMKQQLKRSIKENKQKDDEKKEQQELLKIKNDKEMPSKNQQGALRDVMVRLHVDRIRTVKQKANQRAQSVTDSLCKYIEENQSKQSKQDFKHLNKEIVKEQSKMSSIYRKNEPSIRSQTVRQLRLNRMSLLEDQRDLSVSIKKTGIKDDSFQITEENSKSIRKDTDKSLSDTNEFEQLKQDIEQQQLKKSQEDKINRFLNKNNKSFKVNTQFIVKTKEERCKEIFPEWFLNRNEFKAVINDDRFDPQLRIQYIMLKEFFQRNSLEKYILCQYLKRFKLFESLRDEILEELSEKMQFKKFEPQVQLNLVPDNLLIIFKGEVKLLLFKQLFSSLNLLFQVKKTDMQDDIAQTFSQNDIVMSNHLDDNQYKYYVRNDELLALLLTYQDYNAVIKMDIIKNRKLYAQSFKSIPLLVELSDSKQQEFLNSIVVKMVPMQHIVSQEGQLPEYFHMIHSGIIARNSIVIIENVMKWPRSLNTWQIQKQLKTVIFPTFIYAGDQFGLNEIISKKTNTDSLRTTQDSILFCIYPHKIIELFDRQQLQILEKIIARQDPPNLKQIKENLIKQQKNNQLYKKSMQSVIFENNFKNLSGHNNTLLNLQNSKQKKLKNWFNLIKNKQKQNNSNMCVLNVQNQRAIADTHYEN